MKIRPLLEGEGILQHGTEEEIQLRHEKGTSYGDATRTNEEAEDLALDARRLKQGGCFDQAIVMYTRCLELDCYNHWYSFHRAEALWVSC